MSRDAALGVKGFSAPAGPLGVRIVKLETGACQGVHVIHDRPTEIEQRVAVHKHLHALLLDDRVIGAGVFVQDIWYWKPEHPPPTTAMRRPPPSPPRSAMMDLTFSTAVSVKVSILSPFITLIELPPSLSRCPLRAGEEERYKILT